MLWEIVGTPHRLLGSMHVLPANVSIPDWYEASHKGIERFVFESDVRRPPARQFGVDTTAAHLKLYGALKIYRRAERLLTANGINKPIQVLVPWRAAMVISNLLIQKFGFSGEYGTDERLRHLADAQKISVDFLNQTRGHMNYMTIHAKNSMAVWLILRSLSLIPSLARARWNCSVCSGLGCPVIWWT